MSQKMLLCIFDNSNKINIILCEAAWNCVIYLNIFLSSWTRKLNPQDPDISICKMEIRSYMSQCLGKKQMR